MSDLIRQLWQIDAESDWTAEEVQAGDGGLRHLERYLADLLNLLRGHCTQVTHAYVAISGIECGSFKPVAAVGRKLEDIQATPTIGEDTLIGTFLNDSKPVHLISEPTRYPNFRGDQAIHEKLLIKLKAHGEFYGFISLDSAGVGVFTDVILREIEDSRPILSRIIAEAVFSMRLRQLGARFDYGGSEDQLRGLYKESVDRTARVFAADGAVLRIFDPDFQLLVAEASCGSVDSSLLTDRAPGEGICGRVFANKEHWWAFAAGEGSETTKLPGVNIPPEENRRLRDLGIQSYIIMRLMSDLRSSETPANLGTLSFFHRRPHSFSWNEIGLFRSFCRRVADTIALHQTNTDLETIAEKLRLQSMRLTQVEIVALLAHDLGHKAFEACNNVDRYIELCRKTMNSTREIHSHQHLEVYAENALAATLTVQRSLQQIRSLSQGEIADSDKEGEFDLPSVIDQVEETMSGALKRNKIAIEKKLTGQLRLRGHKAVLAQVFFNLVINSIDAIRSRRTSRPSTIHIHAHEERQGNAGRAIIQLWDEGPGIHRQKFPNPHEIFEIGKTTKASGTGVGLPVSRSLLGRYFSGSLTLEDPTTARFRVVIPMR